MVEQGKFRKDLYFRLNVVNLKIPPLRTRREDIPVLAMHFLERLERETGIAYELSDEALRTMTEYDWPGNVRELENAIERASALSSGPILPLQRPANPVAGLAPAAKGAGDHHNWPQRAVVGGRGGAAEPRVHISSGSHPVDCRDGEAGHFCARFAS